MTSLLQQKQLISAKQAEQEFEVVSPDEFLKRVEVTKAYCFDVEYEPEQSKYQGDFQLAGCGFATDNAVLYETDRDTLKHLIQQLFQSSHEAVAHNGKSDLLALLWSDTIEFTKYPQNFVDTMVAENLIDENIHPKNLGLKPIIARRFHYQMMDFKTVYAHGMQSKEFREYGMDDAKWEFILWKHQKPRLEEENLSKIFHKLLMPSLKTFVDIEYFGFKWDVEGASHLGPELTAMAEQLKQEICDEIGEINLNSPIQLRDRFFNTLGYSTKGLQLTPKGAVSLNEESLQVLAKKYPICHKLMEYRTLTKLNGTYVQPITQAALQDRNHRVHTSFWLTSTTGRTRSSDPTNLQNIPVVTTIKEKQKDERKFFVRSLFVPEKEWVFLSCDYSQIELRFIAHLSDDPVMLAAYRNWQCTNCLKKGESIHQTLRACPNCGIPENDEILKNPEIKGFWHGLDLHGITTDSIAGLYGNRSLGKACNFALVYKATAWKMHFEHPNISVDEWEEIIHDFFKKYRGVARWHDVMEQQLCNQPIFVEPFGRKRRIPKAQIISSYKHCLNQIMNFKPQAGACHLGQLGLSKLRDRFIEQKVWGPEIKAVNFVHDEIVFEAKKDRKHLHIPTIIDIMENTVKFKVPIRIDIKESENWNVKGR